MEKAEIKKIVLDLGDKEVELTPEQAKSLWELLDELYGKVVHPVTYPIYIDRYVPHRPYWYYDHAVWSSSGGTAISYSSRSCAARIVL